MLDTMSETTKSLKSLPSIYCIAAPSVSMFKLGRSKHGGQFRCYGMRSGSPVPLLLLAEAVYPLAELDLAEGHAFEYAEDRGFLRAHGEWYRGDITLQQARLAVRALIRAQRG